MNLSPITHSDLVDAMTESAIDRVIETWCAHEHDLDPAQPSALETMFAATVWVLLDAMGDTGAMHKIGTNRKFFSSALAAGLSPHVVAHFVAKQD